MLEEDRITTAEVPLLPQETTIVTANAWETIDSTQIHFEGRMLTWYQVKGKMIDRNEPITDTPDYYIIYYNPTTNEWLKIVNPFYLDPSESNRYDKLLNQLTRAKNYGTEAVKRCGVEEEVYRQFRMVRVTIQGREMEAFICPHLGPTIDRYVKENMASPTLIEKVYTLAYKEAARLFLRTGIWMYDPNPGNIVLHFNQQGIPIVTLIDFSNREQIRPREAGTLRQSLFELLEMFNKHAQALHARINLGEAAIEQLLQDME